MTNPIPETAVVVSRDAFESTDPYDIIQSNISFLNLLFEEYFTPDEVSPDGLRSYYVDYYLAQVENGGFSQFVYNSRLSDTLVGLIREGLRFMKATRHAELFERGLGLVEKLGPDRLDDFYMSDYFGENQERDELNAINKDFFKLSEEENLADLNSAWLRGLPDLAVLTIEHMEEEIRERVARQPDREERIAAARANEPRYITLMRKLCEAAGHEFSHPTAGDPSHQYQGQTVFAFHFITDKGHHYMLDQQDRALMFDGDSDRLVVEVAL